MNAPLRWGFVGLGELGLPMALRMLDSSAAEVAVLHHHRRQLDEVVAAGAVDVGDVAGLAGAADFISVAVRDAAQIDRLLLGKNGLLSVLRPGARIVIHSTVSPATILRAAMAAEVGGVHVIDAAVTGLPSHARLGEITFFVGGASPDVDAAMPGLRALGRQVLHMGPLGTGVATKIVNNAISVTSVPVVAEAARAGLAAGIGHDRLMEALTSGSAASFVTENWDFFEHGWIDYDGVDRVRDRVAKDLELALELATDRRLDLPVARVAINELPGALIRLRADLGK